MSLIYATLMIMGHKEWREVPHVIRDRVRQDLINLDAEFLITED